MLLHSSQKKPAIGKSSRYLFEGLYLIWCRKEFQKQAHVDLHPGFLPIRDFLVDLINPTASGGFSRQSVQRRQFSVFNVDDKS